MSKFFYDLFLLLYKTAAWMISPWTPKAKQWIKGRENWRKRMNDEWSAVNASSATTVWMHCSSLGEFEQGRPVLESLKQKNQNLKIIITFFSPSGYEIQKNYTGADMVCYLPMDGKTNAKNFLDIIQPSLVLWVKYDYWFYFLKEINTRNLTLLLISGIFRPSQPFFKWYGNLHRKMLNCFSHLFVQNENSYDLILPLIGKEKITVGGDTRFDRVTEIAKNFSPIPEIENWLNGSDKIVVAGSTWPEDEEELTHFVKLHPEIKFIIVPHHIDAVTVADTMELFPTAIKWTEKVKDGGWQIVERETEDTSNGLYKTAVQQPSFNKNVLLVDTIGLLSRLYYYATVAFVGGGFGDDGVHNVLEAAVYGKPVIHGPEFDKYPEAKGLVDCGGAFDVADALELESVLGNLFSDQEFYGTAAKAAKQFVLEQQGATEKTVDYIMKNAFLPVP